MVSYNLACYLPSSASNYLPSAIACPPPPTLLQTLHTAVTSPLSSTYTVLRSSMDALMSLPFLSFLLIPTMTSYSTSLNLLFFYLTWSTLVLSHPPLRVEIVASLAIKILFYILPSTVFLAFDLALPSVSESVKSLGSAALPLRNLTRKKSPKHLKIIAWSLANILLAITLQALSEYILTNVLSRRSALKVTTTLPLPWAIAKDLLRGLILRDVLTYMIHRYLLHAPKSNSLTRDLTRLHETWYHAQVRAPFPLSPSYDHPLVYLLRSSLPIYVPAMIWRFHLLTYIVYLTLISLEEAFTHSGYSHLPTHFVLGGIARRNDMHCLSHGEGNFGTWGLTDWIMGTSIGGDLAEDLIDEAQDTEVKAKVGRGVRKGVRGVRGRINGTRGDKSSSGSGVEKARRRTTRQTRVDSDYED